MKQKGFAPILAFIIFAAVAVVILGAVNYLGPQNSQIPQTPQLSAEEIQKQVDEKLNTELEARRLKANEARKTKQQEHLDIIQKLLQEKKEVTNQDVRDLTHVSQSTATEYLSMLVKSGSIKMEGKGPATVYKNIFS